MSPSVPDDELRAARRLLAEAESQALDEVLAIRSAAALAYDEVLALRREATELAATAAQEAERLRTDRAELDARLVELNELRLELDRFRQEVEIQTLSVAPAPAEAEEPAGRAPDPSLDGTRAEMLALTELLDQLAGRVSALGDQHRGPGERA